MPLKRMSDKEMKEKLHLREEVREIVAQRGLTDILKIDPEFMELADRLTVETLGKAPKSKLKKGAKKAVDEVAGAAGPVAGASYLGANAANVAGAPDLAYGYFAGGLPGFVNAVPNVVKHWDKMTKNWGEASDYQRYKDVKETVRQANGLAGNTRNVVVQSAEGFGGASWNSPGFSLTESGMNPAQLEADIAFNIINNSIVAINGVEQIYESEKRKKDLKVWSASIRDSQIEGVDGIQEVIKDQRIQDIMTSLKNPEGKKGLFIPALTKMAAVVEELHNDAVAGKAPQEKVEQLKYVKEYLEENIDAFEATEKLIRSNAMAMKQAKHEKVCGTYDLVKGSVCVAAISTRFISSPMGGIAGLVDGLTGVVGDAALKGKFFGLEGLWDGKSIIGQHNRRKAAEREVDAAICLCGDRDYNVKSATHQLVEDVIKDYNKRNPEDTLPMNDKTKRSIASKVYYELGSVERSKAGLGNNAMLIRAAQLRTATLEEPNKNGPYHWCIKSLGLDSTGDELPSVDQIAQKMGCDRNWRKLVKNEEIDEKEKKWAIKQGKAQGQEGSGTGGDRRREQAKEAINQALENATPKRKAGRSVFIKRVQLEEDVSASLPQEEPLPARTAAARAAEQPVRQLSSAELQDMGVVKRRAARQEKLELPDVPDLEPEEIAQSLSTRQLSKKEAKRSSVKKRQMLG